MFRHCIKGIVLKYKFLPSTGIEHQSSAFLILLPYYKRNVVDKPIRANSIGTSLRISSNCWDNIDLGFQFFAFYLIFISLLCLLSICSFVSIVKLLGWIYPHLPLVFLWDSNILPKRSWNSSKHSTSSSPPPPPNGCTIITGSWWVPITTNSVEVVHSKT